MRDIISIVVLAINFVVFNYIHRRIEDGTYRFEDTENIMYSICVISVIAIVNIDFQHFVNNNQHDNRFNQREMLIQRWFEEQQQRELFQQQINAIYDIYIENDTVIRIKEKECCICLENVNSEDTNNKIIQHSTCKTCFHQKCLEKCITLDCPFCRQVLSGNIKKYNNDITIIENEER